MPTWPLVEIQKLLEPTLSHMGYSIYSLSQGGGGGRTLRITIDKSQGFISLDDCERVSQVAGPLLDQADLIPDSYTLEVSSPGAERKLRDRAEYERFLGRKVNIRYRSGETEVALEGQLASVDDSGVLIRGRKNEVTSLEWTDIIAGRLVASL
ncbi:MAG TPA: ribosome maturation factor RimP [Candidatus Dormibacteraeota bacterium]|nr:ribosome maturation factor RimP [Candidatus Dormibacteraeota bacterium]